MECWNPNDPPRRMPWALIAAAALSAGIIVAMRRKWKRFSEDGLMDVEFVCRGAR